MPAGSAVANQRSECADRGRRHGGTAAPSAAPSPPAGSRPGPRRLPVFFIPVDTRGAHVMVCDEICLNAVRDRLPIEECLPLTTSVVCATCYACSLTVEGTHCPCA